METQRNFNHFLSGRGAQFTQGEKFLEGTLPVGRPWLGSSCPALMLVIPAQSGRGPLMAAGRCVPLRVKLPVNNRVRNILQRRNIRQFSNWLIGLSSKAVM
jgi:hypothetical protein